MTAIVLLVKPKLSHKSGETADALIALLMPECKARKKLSHHDVV